MSGGDQADIDPGGALLRESSRLPERAVPGFDVDLLIQDAVRRIAATVLVEPGPAVSTPDGSSASAERRDAANSEQPGSDAAEEDVAPVAATEAAVYASAAEPNTPPTEPDAPAIPDGALGYVPRDDDRILPAAPHPISQRIEPRFDAVAPARTDDFAFRPAEAILTEASDGGGSSRDGAAPSDQGGFRQWLAGPWTWRRVARLAGLAVAAYFATVLFLILAYRFINPPTTTLIAYQWLTGTKIAQEWVPIEDISSNLLRAVVVSEDWGFCNHYGVDLDAIEKALEQAGEGKVARGASTISMQVIKNLFLSQSKSYLRKAVEIPLTFAAEAVWPKERMLEIYLNIAEWGPGIFGAEAAARHHFNKPASRLSEREAALLAAALPNPILRDAGDPGTRTARKASVIQSRMRAAGPVADCAMTGRQRASEAAPGGGSKPGAGWQTTVKKRAGAEQGL